MQVQGKIIEIGNTVQVTDTFKKRSIVLEVGDNPQYLDKVEFELTQDKVNLADSYKTGDTVEAHFNLRGREWVDKSGVKKYFNTLAIWRLSTTEGTPVMAGGDDESEDLPF